MGKRHDLRLRTSTLLDLCCACHRPRHILGRRLPERDDHGGMEHSKLPLQVARAGVHLGLCRRAVRLRICRRRRMAFDDIGHVKEVFQVLIPWMPDLAQRTPDQHPRRARKPPSLLPTHIARRFADQQKTGGVSAVRVRFEPAPGLHRGTDRARGDLTLECVQRRPGNGRGINTSPDPMPASVLHRGLDSGLAPAPHALVSTLGPS